MFPNMLLPSGIPNQITGVNIAFQQGTGIQTLSPLSTLDLTLNRLACYTGDRTRIRNDCAVALSQYPGLKPSAQKGFYFIMIIFK